MKLKLLYFIQFLLNLSQTHVFLGLFHPRFAKFKLQCGDVSMTWDHVLIRLSTGPIRKCFKHAFVPYWCAHSPTWYASRAYWLGTNWCSGERASLVWYITRQIVTSVSNYLFYLPHPWRCLIKHDDMNEILSDLSRSIHAITILISWLPRQQ